MFDSRQYEWADLTLILGGQDLTGIRAVKYEETIERELVHAKGREPQYVQSGNKGYKGEIELLGSDYEALVKAGDGTVLSLRLDGLFAYGDPDSGDAPTYDRAYGIHFTATAKDWKQGDKFTTHKLPFICLRIKNQV